MADNQMVKIVFDFDLGNVPASAKKLSQYLKDNNLDLKFTKQSVDNVTASLNQFSTAQIKAGNAAAAAGNSVKKSNMQWTNLALVVQDLPYGFRGIQNNLPALMGGIAGMAGPLYLVGSAIIALFTAWDAGLFKVKDSTNALKDAQKEYNDTLKSSMGAAGEEIAKMNALVSIAGNHKISMEDRLIAVKKLQDEYPAYFGNLDKEKILNGDVATAVDTVKIAIIERAKATAIASKINKLSAEKFAKDEELYQLALQKTAKVQSAISFVKKNPSQEKYLTGLITGQVSGIRDQENAIKLFVNNIDKELNRLGDLYTKSAKDSIKLNDGKGGKTSIPTLQDPNIKLLEAKKQYYKDDLLMSASFEQEILTRQMNLAVKQAELEKKSGTYIQTIKDTYNQLILNSQAETGKKIIEEQHKIGVEEAKEHQTVAKMILNTRFDLADGIAKINSDFAKEDIKNVEAQLSSTLKATKGNYQAQAAAIQGSIDKINAYKTAAIEAGYGTAEYDKELEKLKATLEGLVDPLEQMEININNTLNSLASGALVELGTQIGNVFSGSAFSLDGFLSMLGDGLIQIGTYLVSISTVFVAIKKLFESGGAFAELAIPIGLAAIATGIVIKNKLVKQNTPKFANGGIVSGPTMGLMGEYPGARSNPEVVAPLDKLKGLMGASGGTLEARISGNDLLILMNKAQRNNNTTF